MLLSTAAALFAAVFVIRQTHAGVGDALALLYVVPIALVALDLGLLAGIAASLLSLLLVGIWMLTSHADLGVVGLLTRGIAYLAVGMIAGRFSDRMRDAQERQHGLLRSGLALAHLQETSGMATAVREAAQAICGSRGVRVEITADPTPVAARSGRTTGCLQIPIEVRGCRYGTLFLEHDRKLTDEDRAALGILALQAAVAAESCHLLAREREHAAIRAQLQEARTTLQGQAGQLREVLTRQENERTQVASELHEQAAQALAAVLLGLRAVERRQSLPDGRTELAGLRSEISRTLQELRALAVALAPSTLSLGTRTAIQELLAGSRIVHVTTALDPVSDVPDDTARMVYRIVEEALAAVGGAHSAEVRADPHGRELTIDLIGTHKVIEPGELTVLNARVNALGGTVTAGTRRLWAHVPIRDGNPTHAPMTAIDSLTASREYVVDFRSGDLGSMMTRPQPEQRGVAPSAEKR